MSYTLYHHGLTSDLDLDDEPAAGDAAIALELLSSLLAFSCYKYQAK
jgi:hypothetical protein